MLNLNVKVQSSSVYFAANCKQSVYVHISLCIFATTTATLFEKIEIHHFGPTLAQFVPPPPLRYVCDSFIAYDVGAVDGFSFFAIVVGGVFHELGANCQSQAIPLNSK